MAHIYQVKVPPGRREVEIQATVSAAWQQRVTVKPEGPLAYLYQWTGSGANGTPIGSTRENRSATEGKVYTVTLEHSEDGGNTWKPNKIQTETISTKSIPPISITTIRSEDGGDKDYDDSIVTFIY